MKGLLFLFMLSIFLVSCGEDSVNTEDITLDGKWVADVTRSGKDYKFTLDLDDDDGVISGTFLNENSVMNISGTVNGAFVYPNANLVVTIMGQPNIFSGKVSSDGKNIEGELTDIDMKFKKK